MFTPPPSRDATALKRQKRRLQKLKGQGVHRSTVFVHEECKEALDNLRPLLLDKKKAQALLDFVDELQTSGTVTNVAQVRHLSLFRYPGGKTWLIPTIRKWLTSAQRSVDVFVEPFAGGAIAGLTAAAENLAYSVALSEIDVDVAAVWTLIFEGSETDVTWFQKRIRSFDVNLETVRFVLNETVDSQKDRAFRTIIKNRMQRGGIMASGAGLVKTGEAGRGLNSRWYPETLALRIDTLLSLRTKVSFQRCDAFDAIEQFSQNPNAFFFLDPPYTAGGKRAGTRLYEHSELDHERLFKVIAQVKGQAMLTYDDTPEVRELARHHGFTAATLPMKNTHHAILNELVLLKS